VQNKKVNCEADPVASLANPIGNIRTKISYQNCLALASNDQVYTAHPCQSLGYRPPEKNVSLVR
jgi:hypothetical protein